MRNFFSIGSAPAVSKNDAWTFCIISPTKFGSPLLSFPNPTHSRIDQAIMARKKAMDDAGGIAKLMAQKAAESVAEGKSGTVRMAFLDLMLDMRERSELDLAGIQEEVDTFTFEVLLT